jgi:hypothetical protein
MGLFPFNLTLMTSWNGWVTIKLASHRHCAKKNLT